MFRPVELQARPRRPGARDPDAVARSPDLRPPARPECGQGALELPGRTRSPPTTRWASTTPGVARTRTCSSASGPCRARDQRYQNGFDCQGLWVEVNVERDLGFTSKRDIEAYGIAEFVSLCKQRVLTYAARQTEQSIRLGMWMDWNDPHELRRLRDELADDPAKQVTVTGTDGKTVTDAAEMVVGRLGMPELGGSYFTFSDENNYLIWSFLAECHRRGLAVQGPRLDALVRSLRDRHQPARDDRGLRRSRGPRPDRQVPAARSARARRCSSGPLRPGR